MLVGVVWKKLYSINTSYNDKEGRDVITVKNKEKCKNQMKKIVKNINYIKKV